MAEDELKTRKRKKATVVSEDSAVVSVPKKKKRKLEDNAVVEDSASPQPEQPEKKKRKNKTGFPDPGDDPALSDQAQKALSYAFLQFRKRTKWKFSKPRQNWLIRNVWSDKIPDMYLALTIQYLSNVQGNAREVSISTCLPPVALFSFQTLIKECRSVLSASSAPQNTTSGEAAHEEQPAIEPDKIKHARARALLDALEATPAEIPKS
ncbi:DNA helicase [Mycena sanguinolenta]|uniref:DNA helicase n=1 Tax=Mycena sanguinolenta TaxID=230812 RepID=A0A8H6YBJ0_9AGAR|nr:DNA helicase [Mycena sanguinolenta]